METCTTKETQKELVVSLFKKYSKVTVSKSELNKYQISSNLDLSFEFLLDYKKDKIPNWIYKSNAFLSFLGGYIDAEGHFGVSNKIGVFSLSSYDKNIIKSITRNVKKYGIKTTKPKISFKKGYTDKRGVTNHKDLWTIRIKRMRELHKFINVIRPHIKHKKRYKDMIAVENNLFSRNTRIKINEEKEILHHNPNLLCK